MTDVNQAATHAKNLAKQFRGVMEVAEVLEEIGNLEQTRAEAGRRAIEAREEAARAADEREKAVKALVQVQGDLDVAKDTVALVIQSSETKAEEIIQKARAEASAKMAMAERTATGFSNQMERDCATHENLIEGLIEEEAKVSAQLAETKEELEKLLKRIGQD